MLVHPRVTPSNTMPVPIDMYTPGWKETIKETIETKETILGASFLLKETTQQWRNQPSLEPTTFWSSNCLIGSLKPYPLHHNAFMVKVMPGGKYSPHWQSQPSQTRHTLHPFLLSVWFHEGQTETWTLPSLCCPAQKHSPCGPLSKLTMPSPRWKAVQ